MYHRRQLIDEIFLQIEIIENSECLLWKIYCEVQYRIK